MPVLMQGNVCFVHVMRLKRQDRMCIDELDMGEHLRSCRSNLADAGFHHGHKPDLGTPWHGPWIFVQPQQFNLVVSATEKLHLRPWHIIASDEFESDVIAALQSLPSRLNCKVTQKTLHLVVPRYACHSVLWLHHAPGQAELPVSRVVPSLAPPLLPLQPNFLGWEDADLSQAL
jgi:hypothetical protein